MLVDEDIIFERQKLLYSLNAEIQQKVKIDESYFDGIKFVFLG